MFVTTAQYRASWRRSSTIRVIQPTCPHVSLGLGKYSAWGGADGGTVGVRTSLIIRFHARRRDEGRSLARRPGLGQTATAGILRRWRELRKINQAGFIPLDFNHSPDAA